MIAHVMPQIAYSAASYSDIVSINRDKLNSWTLLGFSAGVTSDTWSAEFFAENLSDERAEIARSFNFDRDRVNYVRPRTMGVRVSYDF
jgi:outer membrane receptor protein involved in Fe transport